MEEMNLNESAPVETSTPEPASAPPAVAPNPGLSGSPGVDPSIPLPPSPEITTWKPSYKFKHLGKELEFDEFVRGSIKDADTEQKIKALYEKAHGLDFLKPKFLEQRERYQEMEGTHGTLTKELKDLGSSIHKKDFDSVFNQLNIPKEAIYNWVVKQLEFEELPAEQKQAIQGQKDTDARMQEMTSQNQHLQSQYIQSQTQIRGIQLDTALSSPQNQMFAQQYDATRGPGAFRNAVIQMGQLAHSNRGEDLTPAQAIQETMRFMMPYQQQPGGEPAPGMQQAQKPPVIPNISAGSKAPVKKVMRSLDDIRARAKELGV